MYRYRYRYRYAYIYICICVSGKPGPAMLQLVNTPQVRGYEDGGEPKNPLVQRVNPKISVQYPWVNPNY